MGEFFILGELRVGIRNEKSGVGVGGWLLRCGRGVLGVGAGVFGVGAGRNARGSVRHTRASNARPYYIIGKVWGCFCVGLPFCL